MIDIFSKCGSGPDRDVMYGSGTVTAGVGVFTAPVIHPHIAGRAPGYDDAGDKPSNESGETVELAKAAV